MRYAFAMMRSLVFTLSMSAVLFTSIGAWAQDAARPIETDTISVDKPVMPQIPMSEIGVVEPAPDALPPEIDVPRVFYDPADLPEPVRLKRQLIMDRAATGDPEQLRAVMDAQAAPPSLSFGQIDDPIAYLTSLSGDEGGREILAILIEVLEAGWLHVDEGTPEETYVWPYFARYPVEALSPQQLVELFKLVYAGDYADMLAYGYYLSYRIGIAPDGSWRYFIAGD